MTASSEQPPGATDRHPWMSKPNRLWLAAVVLGGILGGVFAFALSRAFPAAPKPPPPPPPTSEARQFADDVITKLKEGKNDEFMPACVHGVLRND